jgi:hypothetical protein
MRLTILPPTVSRLSRQCGILTISQLYRPALPAKSIAFIYKFDRTRLLDVSLLPKLYDRCSQNFVQASDTLILPSNLASLKDEVMIEAGRDNYFFLEFGLPAFQEQRH